MDRSICVFCGANFGSDPIFEKTAKELGQSLAKQKIRLIYGGGGKGLMGAVADACLMAGGEVVGVIPQFMMEREWGHMGLTKLIIVQSMHERKAVMAGYADAFIAMPGGIGTMEELFETWTWAQLGIQKKPYGLLNVASFYDGLIGFIHQMRNNGFVEPHTVESLLVDSNPNNLIEKIRNSKVW